MRSLSDVVSGAGLAVYAEVALLIFVVTFIALGLRVLLATDYDVNAQLPFDGDPHTPTRTAAPTLEQSSAHAVNGAVHVDR